MYFFILRFREIGCKMWQLWRSKFIYLFIYLICNKHSRQTRENSNIEKQCKNTTNITKGNKKHRNIYDKLTTNKQTNNSI